MADRVKAEYFNAKDKATGEIKEVQFIPPAPSDGDLGGISQEKLEQIDKLNEDLATAENGISLVHKNVLGNFLRNGTQLVQAGRPFNSFIPDNTRVITNDIFLKTGEKCYIKASGFDKYLWFYSNDGETITENFDWKEANFIDEDWSFNPKVGDKHVKFVFAKANNSELPVYEIDFKIIGDKMFSDGLYERVNFLEKNNKKTCLNRFQ